MSLYNIIDKHMLLPIGDMVYRSNINTQWERLKRTEFVSKTDLTELQNTKLRKLIHHCYNTVPYYHELFPISNVKKTYVNFLYSPNKPSVTIMNHSLVPPLTNDTEEHHLREEVQVHPCSFVPTNENGAYNVLPR